MTSKARIAPICAVWMIFYTAMAFAVTDALPETPPPRAGQGIHEPERPLRRMPPRPAMKACNGKRSGDSCAFNAPHGIVEGICLSDRENIFACRPKASRPVPENSPPLADQRLPAEQQSEAENLPQKEALPLKSMSKPVRPAETAPLRQQAGSNETAPPQEAHPPIILAPAPPPENPLPPLPPKDSDKMGRKVDIFFACLAVAIIAVLSTWYGFFRHSTLPLRRLRKVTQQLAGGDLSARVGEGLVHRKDEVADLGRDVDRMAERIESLVGAHQRLIRDVSHELRSPLARLNVALELARHSAGPAHSAPFDRIERESIRLNELISQLLTLTRLESDNARIAKDELDLAALLAEIALDVDFEAESRNRRVEVVTTAPAIINGNRELLRQSVENVVRNAIRHTAEGTVVELSLATRKLLRGTWVVLEVRDHGAGVPESELSNIFRPFYRVSDGRERESGGTGVGLAISDRAVRIHGGSIQAVNATGGGLTVRIELPLGLQ